MISKDMDYEIQQLAAHALAGQYWVEFSALVNAYVAAGRGLDADMEELLSDVTSVYGRDLQADGPGATVRDEAGRRYSTVEEALSQQDRSIKEIYIGVSKVFELRADGWYFVGDIA